MIVDAKYEKNKNLLAISLVNKLLNCREKPVFLCVGTDKIVGDSIGAIVGELLKSKYKIDAHIYGNLDKNITASNIEMTVNKIKNIHPYSPIILVDGILGELEEVGQIKFYPHGAIPSGQFNRGVFVGDYSILAVVDTKGVDTLNFLKSVKLKTVYEMALFIAESIVRAYKFSQNLV